MMCVPTSSFGLAGVDQQAGVEPALRLGQAVADLLETPGQPGVVEGEADVILDDPEPLARPVGRGIEDPGEVHAAPGLGQVQGGDLGGHRDRPRFHGDSPRQALAQRLELQTGGTEQLGDGFGGGHQAGQQVLGAHLASPIQGVGLAHRLAQDQPQGGRPGQGLRRFRALLGFGLILPCTGAQGLLESDRRHPELHEQLGRPTLDLERQRGQKVQGLDQRRAAAPGHRIRTHQRPLRSRRIRLEHQHDDSVTPRKSRSDPYCISTVRIAS